MEKLLKYAPGMWLGGSLGAITGFGVLTWQWWAIILPWTILAVWTEDI